MPDAWCSLISCPAKVDLVLGLLRLDRPHSERHCRPGRWIPQSAGRCGHHTEVRWSFLCQRFYHFFQPRKCNWLPIRCNLQQQQVLLWTITCHLHVLSVLFVAKKKVKVWPAWSDLTTRVSCRRLKLFLDNFCKTGSPLCEHPTEVLLPTSPEWIVLPQLYFICSSADSLIFDIYVQLYTCTLYRCSAFSLSVFAALHHLNQLHHHRLVKC